MSRSAATPTPAPIPAAAPVERPPLEESAVDDEALGDELLESWFVLVADVMLPVLAVDASSVVLLDPYRTHLETQAHGLAYIAGLK